MLEQSRACLVTPQLRPDYSLLRHIIATIAYRGGKAIEAAPEGFATFRLGDQSRTPVQILAHIGDLFDWALALMDGVHRWTQAEPMPWPQECARFLRTLQRLDDRLSAGTPVHCTAERLFQGPLADSLTHIGQIAMLRRLSGSAVRGENYFKASIEKGRLQAEPGSPRVEFT